VTKHNDLGSLGDAVHPVCVDEFQGATSETIEER
jgi:hypothetical protein